MISRARFQSLRLSDYFPPEQITHPHDWELFGRTWISEGVGCRGLELDLSQIAAERILSDLEIPFVVGADFNAVGHLFGAHVRELKFVRDRKTREC